MTQATQDEDNLLEENITEVPKMPPPAQKISKFGNQGASKFGKGATNFNPPNKQRPGRAAGRGR